MDATRQTERLGSRPNASNVPCIVAVPAVEWRSFLEGFSARHRGWLATIHGFARGGLLTRIRSHALASVSLERRDLDDLIRLTLANGISLCAPKPRAVRVQRLSDGAESALEVETAAGGLIRLAFRATALSEQLDGVAPAELNAPLH
jgi:hypothetical protein